jgi:hypothetical protein
LKDLGSNSDDYKQYYPLGCSPTFRSKKVYANQANACCFLGLLYDYEVGGIYIPPKEKIVNFYHTTQRHIPKDIVMCVTTDGVWIGDLTIYAHGSELQAITAPPLISTILKSPQNLLSLFHPDFTSRFLVTALVVETSAVSSLDVC